VAGYSFEPWYDEFCPRMTQMFGFALPLPTLEERGIDKSVDGGVANLESSTSIPANSGLFPRHCSKMIEKARSMIPSKRIRLKGSWARPGPGYLKTNYLKK
jgi:hypothetical protein